MIVIMLAGAVAGLGLFMLVRLFIQPRPGVAATLARIDASRRGTGGPYIPTAELAELSTLEEDDEESLCALYPPDPTDAGAGGAGGPSPGGQGAGCSVARPGAQMPNGATLGAVWTGAMLLLLGLKRRRVSSTLRPAR